MSIVFVSTWDPQECGIATYSGYLTQALRTHGARVSILAEKDPVQPFEVSHAKAAGEIPVYRVWDRRAPENAPLGLGGLVKVIESSSKLPAVVHFQHEFGLFPDSIGFVSTLRRLAEKTRVVVTLHTVVWPPGHAGFFRELAGLRKVTFIVHTYAGAAALRAWGVEQNVIIIRHGACTPGATYAVLDGPPATFLCPGFMGESKGQAEIVEAAGRLRAMGAPRFSLALVGLCRDVSYEAKIKSAIFAHALGDCVAFKEGFHPEPVMRGFFAAAKAVILGSGKTTPMSASGQLHTALGHGMPVLAKDVPIYREAGSGTLYWSTPEELAYLMKAMLAPQPRLALALLAKEEGEARAWPKVAAEHLTVYGLE